MVEFLVVQVVYGPAIRAPVISLANGTMTVSIPGSCSGTVVAGTAAPELIPDGALARIVTARLIPAWDAIRGHAEQIVRSQP